MPHDPLFLATAVEIVIRAGDMQRERYGTDLRVTKKGAIDLVTEVDVAVERMFRAAIAERFPDHAILAEELGAREGRWTLCGGPRWVFDPLDGTTNFAHGVPFFCASLALEIDGQPEVAAVYDPLRQELFTAERGGGARLNGRRLRVSDTATLPDALLCTGFPYTLHADVERLVALFGRFLAGSRAVRRLGSAALDLCYVAAGRLDGYWEQGLHPWDISAGALLVEGAGGRVTDLGGGPFDAHRGEIVASNGRIHDQMLHLLEPVGTDRSQSATD